MPERKPAKTNKISNKNSRVLAIIAEYNPLHKGHIYHIKESIKAVNPKYTIVLMSGNFTQRGELAVKPKEERAKELKDYGVDLVIELPFIFSSQTAEVFAFGAISILNSLGVVTHLSFGSEVGDINVLNKIAKASLKETKKFKELLKKNLATGESHIRARIKTLKELNKEIDFSHLSQPNNVLGIEYIRQLYKTNSKIIPFCVKRDKNKIPITSKEIRDKNFKRVSRVINKNLSLMLIYKLNINDILSMNSTKGRSKFTLSDTFDATSEIRNRIENEYSKIKNTNLNKKKSKCNREKEGFSNYVKSESLFETLTKNCSSKNLTKARIRRILLNYVFEYSGQKENYWDPNEIFVEVLSNSIKGRELIKILKKTSEIPVITNMTKQQMGFSEKQKSLKKYLKSLDTLYSHIVIE